MHDPRPATRRPRGFTLVEAAVSIVIVGVMLTAALSMLGGAAGARRKTARWREGESIARSLMAEVQQSGYGSTSGLLSLVNITLGTDRSGWLTVDQYNGFSETAPTDRTGTALTGYSGWRRSVLVERVDPLNPDGPGRAVSSDTGLKRITVVATSPNGEKSTLVALRSRWGMVEAGAAQNGVVLSGLEIGIAVGAGGRPLFTAITVPNNTSEATRVTTLPAGGFTPAAGATGIGSESGLLGGVVTGVTDALGGLLGGGG